MEKPTHKSVKFTPEEMADDLPAELDFSKLKVVGRGPAAVQSAMRRRRVSLAPDVAERFPDEAAVNDALRTLIHLGDLLRAGR